ncbi:hypothetical protein ACGFNV_44510 [Streptomyces sp. NPDC048751]|uniref:hypothetical protein n=1 Tax=Streptomyces sp. NPDC048751 TaxID=3365591 RepID=UPI0037226E6D
MNRHHAVEVILTQPVTSGELRHSCRIVPLAANADRTRLMALQRAHSPGGALHMLRRRLGSLLPIDVLTSHYPNRHGHILLNVDLKHTAAAAIRQAATVRGQRPQDFLGRCVTDALAEHEQRRRRLLEARLEDLLVHHPPEDILACAGSLLDRRRPPAAP